MWPLELSLFLLHHRRFMIRLRLLQLLQYIYRYFRIDNSMPFFFAAASRTIFQRNEFRRPLLGVNEGPVAITR